MNLNLYNEDMQRISIIGTSFVSCLWAEGYNTTEDFILEVQATKEYKSKLRPDCYVGRDDRKTLMVIKSITNRPVMEHRTGGRKRVYPLDKKSGSVGYIKNITLKINNKMPRRYGKKRALCVEPLRRRTSSRIGSSQNVSSSTAISHKSSSCGAS